MMKKALEENMNKHDFKLFLSSLKELSIENGDIVDWLQKNE